MLSTEKYKRLIDSFSQYTHKLSLLPLARCGFLTWTEFESTVIEKGRKKGIEGELVVSLFQRDGELSRLILK